MTQRFCYVTLLFALVIACKKEPPPEPSEPAPIPEPPAVASAAAEPEVQADSLPTVEDFEEEAEKEVTAANLEKELDALEKEIESN